MTEVVPAPVRDLIRERIQALEQLEVLLLARAHPERSWSAEQLSARLQLSELTCQAALAHLDAHGLLEETQRGQFRYAPRSDEMAEAVSELAHTYADGRVEVLALISSDAVGRVRRRARALMETLKVGK